MRQFRITFRVAPADAVNMATLVQALSNRETGEYPDTTATIRAAVAVAAMLAREGVLRSALDRA